MCRFNVSTHVNAHTKLDQGERTLSPKRGGDVQYHHRRGSGPHDAATYLNKGIMIDSLRKPFDDYPASRTPTFFAL